MNFLQKCLIAGLTSSLILVGCASRPESIPATHVAHEKYSMNSCDELAVLRADARTDLQTISSKQNSKANWDAVSVWFILIPASQLTGDVKADVAKAKGEVEAIETAQAVKGC